MIHFVLTDHGDRTEYRAFKDSRAAMDYLLEREALGEKVCLFGSDSLETLRVTHSSWFHDLWLDKDGKRVVAYALEDLPFPPARQERDAGAEG